MHIITKLYLIISFIHIFSLPLSCKSINQLSFSGGGSFGAVEIGILHKIRNFYKVNYDIHTGISAGGINAAFLSHFSNIDEGIVHAKHMYDNTKNNDVFSLVPPTHISVLNTNPLQCTLYNKIKSLNKPVIPTYVGATNLYTGNLDVFRYDVQTNIQDMVSILLCTSAIPIIFPPISFNNAQYADGGTLQNELLTFHQNNDYLNITFITPFVHNIYDDTPIKTLSQMTHRTFDIIKHSFNNEFSKINDNCDTYTGEINRYYVDYNLLRNYDMLNFNDGQMLYEIGYNHTIHDTIYIC